MALPNIGLNVMTCPGPQNPIDTAVWAEANGYQSVWMTDGGAKWMRSRPRRRWER